MSIDYASLVTSLTTTLTTLLQPYATPPQPFALLDFPNHPNVGDSAIWLGTTAYFSSVFGTRPTFVAGKENFDANALKHALPNGTIYLLGGGNFGDIWPEYQVFRESIMEQFPDHRIIQLPQSIHFGDSGLIAKTATAIKKHGNFILFVRDKPSFALASSSFDCPVHLSPDMAFWLGILPRPVPATIPLLLLLRTDKERSRQNILDASILPKHAVVADWLDEDPELYRKQKYKTLITSVAHLGVGAFSRQKQRDLLFQNLATNRLHRGLNLLSQASFIITDRLHCHILCILLGIPHIRLDNSYGKLGGFVDAWTKDCGLVQMASTLDEAITLWSQSHRRTRLK